MTSNSIPNSSAVPRVSPTQPRFEHFRAMRIAGLRQSFTSASLDEIPELWRRLMSLGKVQGRTSRVDYGVVLLHSDRCDYLAGFEVTESAALPADLDCIQIPANEYAVFSHDGHVSKLRDTFDAAVNRWLPASSLEIARPARGEPYVLERYGEGFNPATGIGDIEVWIPVWRPSRR